MAVVAVSCDIFVELDAGTRLVAEATVTNAQGVPLDNVLIGVTAAEGNANARVMTTETDADGHIRTAFVAPASNDTEIYLLVESPDETLLPTYINGLHKSDFTGYYRHFGTIRLYRQSELILLNIDYHNAEPGTSISDVYIEAQGSLRRSSPDPLQFTSYELVAPNQQAILHYTLHQGAEHLKKEAVITIGETETNYTLAY